MSRVIWPLLMLAITHQVKSTLHGGKEPQLRVSRRHLGEGNVTSDVIAKYQQWLQYNGCVIRKVLRQHLRMIAESPGITAATSRI